MFVDNSSYLKWVLIIWVVFSIVSSPLAFINVTNIQNHETVGYQLLLLKGEVSDNISTIDLHNNSTQKTTSGWPVVQGKYKASILLKPGPNEISLETSDEIENIIVYWRPLTSQDVGRFRRLIYVIPSDHDVSDYGKFQAPNWEENGIESAKLRMRLAGLQAQAAVAELMYDKGMGRKTFRLERDENEDVKVTVHISDRTFKELQDLQPQPALPSWLERNELNRLPNSQNAHPIITSSVTRYLGTPLTGCYNDCPHIILAGEMWGGGNWAWFHSANLFTWPEEIEEIIERGSDNREPQDFNLYPSRHSRREKTMWAAYSTTAGSMFHEVGHGYGLGHTNSSCGIMGFGFHNWIRLFLMQEGGDSYNNDCFDWDQNQVSSLNNSSALALPDAFDPVGDNLNKNSILHGVIIGSKGIKIKFPGNHIIQIIDTKGKIKKTYENDGIVELKFDENLPRGMYSIRVSTPKGIVIKQQILM